MEVMSCRISSDFVRSLRAYMECEEISGAELARRLGVTRQYVYHLLADDGGSLSFETAEKLLARIGGQPRLSVEFQNRTEKIAG